MCSNDQSINQSINQLVHCLSHATNKVRTGAMLISIMQNGVHGHKVNTSLIDCNYLTGPIIVKNNDDKA